MIHRSPPVQHAKRPTPPPAAPSSASDPCAVCGHVPGAGLPPGRILRNARRANRPNLNVDQFLELAESTRSAAWFSDLENHRKTIPSWPEWSKLCEAAGIDAAKTAAGEAE